MVYCWSGSSAFSSGMISSMWMPSMFLPCESATLRSSTEVSASVMYSVDSPRRTPSSKNCRASVVLPVPGSPSTR